MTKTVLLPLDRAALAIIEKAWGAAAAAAAAKISPGSGGVRVAGPPAMPWVQTQSMAIPAPSVDNHFYAEGLWDDGVWGVDAVRLLVQGTRPSTENAADIMAAFDQLHAGHVVRTSADVKRWVNLIPNPEWVEPAVPADPEVRRLFEPPYVDGPRVIFQANTRTFGQDRGPAWVRVVVDTNTCSVDVTRLARGANEGVRFYLRGRGYEGVEAWVPQTSEWVQSARAEHASVASFARTTLELMAVGAPLELLARVQRAALDEIEHTRLSLALARSEDGVDVELGPLPALPPRAPRLASVAVHTLLEAAHPETLATLEARRAAASARNADVRSAWIQIAADEARHAELAWDILAWCVGADSDGSVRTELSAVDVDPCVRERLSALLASAHST